MQKDVVVVGAGLMGSVVAAHLRVAQGREVLVVDAARPHAASPAASCLMKPGWYGAAFAPAQARAALEVLDRLYGVRTLEFRMESGKTTPIYWVPPSDILAPPHFRAEVTSIRSRTSGVELVMTRHGTEERMVARHVIIAAGVWSSTLARSHLLERGLSGRAGCANVYLGVLGEPRMREWAPYKQMLAFNIRKGRVWVGDGSAILPANWPKHEAASWARCDKEANYLPIDQRILGIRPYWKAPEGRAAAPCFLEQVEPRVWVATGAAKNGTICAGWAARELERRL